ncbi:MAG TPA: methyltransferase domain-containing protein [Candidatus Acidoferrales bacterium]|nr:methyltransferase domain-containing protein [Candidatus Acidoferrales bacterium]
MPRNWDDHYSNTPNLARDPAPLLVEVADMLPPGHALDLACGPGRNALYLARLGWQVTAVDSSPAAIGLLTERAGGLAIHAHLADLAQHQFAIAPAAYDLICDFLYLQRDLFPSIRDGVRPGGMFAGAILLFDESRLFDQSQPSAISMRPGELRAEFHGWKILFYSEGAEPNHTRRAARIIARRA